MREKTQGLLYGILIGAFIFGATPTIANNIFDVTPNPFKVTVDGQIAEIEGYNINGSTYFKLRDIGNSVGFGVDFQEDTIMINTVVSKDTTPVGNDTQSVVMGYYDAIFSRLSSYYTELKEYDGESFIYMGFLELLPRTGIEAGVDTDGRISEALKFWGDNDSTWVEDRKTGEILGSIPTYRIPWYEDGGLRTCIKFSDFETHIKPHIDKILDEYGIPK